MAQELEKGSYVSRIDSKIGLRDPKSLLEDWVREYDYKRNQERMGSFGPPTLS
jgi:hypothetical protein